MDLEIIYEEIICKVNPVSAEITDYGNKSFLLTIISANLMFCYAKRKILFQCSLIQYLSFRKKVSSLILITVGVKTLKKTPKFFTLGQSNFLIMTTFL